MRDIVDRNPPPGDEDPLVHSRLSTAPSFEPSTGFDDRVLTWVRRPAPPAALEARRALERFARSGQVWYWVGALALGSLIPWMAGIAALAAEPALPGMAARWAAEGLSAAGRELAAVAAAARVTPSGAVLLLPGGLSLPAVAGTALTLWIGCALGLYRVMRPKTPVTGTNA
jgi:hypothetical protein